MEVQVEESVNDSYYYYDSTYHMENATNYTDNLSEVLENDTSKKSELFDPSEYTIVLYILYGTICITAIVGNLIVLWLVLGSRRMWNVSNMLLSNLAFADITMAVFIIPFHFQAALSQRWNLPHCLCPIYPFVQVVSVTVSVFTLSAISLHRYKGIISPFTAHISRRKAAWALLIMWIFCSFIAIPNAIDYSIIHFQRKDGKIIDYCHNVGLSTTFRKLYNQFLVIVQYVFPLLTISFAYIRLGRQLLQIQTPGNADGARDEKLLRTRRNATTTITIITFTFGICWFPYQLYNFLLTLTPSVNNYPYINVIWFAIHWLAMSNSCCNPFIYGIYSGNFRNEFRRRLHCVFGSNDEQINIVMVELARNS